MQLGSANSIDATTLLGLTRFLTGTQDNVSAFSDANIKALLNLENKLLQAEVLSGLNYDWKENTIDGSGSGSISLVAGVNAIAFPTDMIQVDRIEVSYTGEMNSYVPARVIPMQGITDRAISNTEENAPVVGSKGCPIVYIRNGVFYLDPIPDVAVAGGMKVWGQTLVSDLASTSDQPVFAKPFHEILAYGAAQRWCASKDKESKANRLFQERTAKRDTMIGFYVTRNATQQPILAAKRRSMK